MHACCDLQADSGNSETFWRFNNNSISTEEQAYRDMKVMQVCYLLEC